MHVLALLGLGLRPIDDTIMLDLSLKCIKINIYKERKCTYCSAHMLHFPEHLAICQCLQLSHKSPLHPLTYEKVEFST